MSLRDKIDTFVTESILEVVQIGGELVSLPQSTERVNFCKTRLNGKPCEYVGAVRPLPFLTMSGCTKCGCPFATKPKTKKYFSPSEGKIILTKCPHPYGNLWAEIDKKYE